MTRKTLKGPNAKASFLDPNQKYKYSYNGEFFLDLQRIQHVHLINQYSWIIDRNGWRSDGVHMTLAKGEVNTVQYREEDDDCSFELAGPSAGASCSVTSDKIKANVNVAAFKVRSEAGPIYSEFSPNLNTGVSYGADGFQTKVGGTGATIALDELSMHTPFGSLGVRLPFGRSKW